MFHSLTVLSFSSGDIFKPMVKGRLKGLFATVIAGSGILYIQFGASSATRPVLSGTGQIREGAIIGLGSDLTFNLVSGFIPLDIPVDLETTILLGGAGGDATFYFSRS
jgi:hypothetical protein